MMDFHVTGVLTENSAYHQPHQQPKRSQGAYFYLFDHVRSVMFTHMFNVCVCVCMPLLILTIPVFDYY